MQWISGDDAAVLVAECEQMLAGHTAGVLARDGAPVPTWAWINLLAHGSELEIRAIARTRPAGDGWLEAQGYLASEMMALVEAGCTTLAELQRDVVLPIELEAMGSGDAGEPSPPQLILRVLSGLDARRVHPQV